MQAHLKRTEIDVQQMIHDRVKKVEDIKQSLELNKVSAHAGNDIKRFHFCVLFTTGLCVLSACSGQC